MAKTEFEARNFIEGSQTPKEEASYWRFLRGERVLLDRVSKEGLFYRLAIDSLIEVGAAKVSKNSVILIKEGVKNGD